MIYIAYIYIYCEVIYWLRAEIRAGVATIIRPIAAVAARREVLTS